MIKRKRDIDTSLFTLKMNNLSIERVDCIQYLGVLLDDKLSWKYCTIIKRISKICGLSFKLHHYVPLSTRKFIYYSMFQSTFLYTSINWRRTTKSCLHQLEVLQNNFIKTSLFLLKTTTINLLYFKSRVLKLKDLVKMEIARFMFTFKN